MESEQEKLLVEAIIRQVRETLSPYASVVRNDRVDSYSGKEKHSVELSVRYRILDYTVLVLVDWISAEKKIDRSHVTVLAKKVYETRANKGILLFQESIDHHVREWAKEHSIDLFSFEEAPQKDWSAGLTVPLLYDLRRPDLKIQFFGKVDEGFIFPGDGLGVNLPMEEGGEISLFSLFQMMWNGGSIPAEPGRYDYPIPVYSSFSLDFEGKSCLIESIIFNVEVSSMKYFGYADLKTCRKVAGILEEQDGKTNLGEMLVDVNTIKQEWEYIPEEQNIMEKLDFPTMIIEVREQVA